MNRLLKRETYLFSVFFFKLGDLKKEAKTKPTSQYIQVEDAEKYFIPFELACKSKSPKVVETSLDCIQVRSSIKILGSTLRQKYDFDAIMCTDKTIKPY